MHLDRFDYTLPSELIARYPLAERSASRLLHLSKQGQVQHRQFCDLGDLLRPNDLLILNDTRVIPARLRAHKTTGGKVEILVERVLSTQQVLAHVKASKAPPTGSFLVLENDLRVEVLGREDDLFRLRFDADVLQQLDACGEIPLPPYFQRAPNELDKQRYQTIYAQHQGSVAAPTAGLHFEKNTLQALQQQGVNVAYVTLHVGAGTFQPVRVDDITKHRMHSELIHLPTETATAIRYCREKGGRVIAVGTTSLRTLEAVAARGNIEPYTGETDLFIYPGYQFQCVDALVTNFHLPKSSLLMLVAAFAGYDAVMTAYSEAVAQRYRFFSYGDAMFLEGL